MLVITEINLRLKAARTVMIFSANAQITAMESQKSGEAIVPGALHSNVPIRSQVDEKITDTPQKSSNAQTSRDHKASQPKKSKTKESRSEAEKSKTEKSKGKSTDGANLEGVPSKSSTQPASGVLPDFVIRRNQLFDELKHRHGAELLEKEHHIINVVLDLGLDKNGKPKAAMPVAAKAWESTPGSFLRHLDKDITSDVVIAKVNGKELWDLDRPLEYDCRISYIPFTSAEGRNVFWHSSAHVLGEAAECHYQCLLSHGPPVEQGFFYDMALAEG